MNRIITDMSARRIAAVWVCAAALLLHATSVSASLVTPNGNPTGPASVSRPDGSSSTLDPSPAVYMQMGNCPWLLPALRMQGISTENGWTFNFATLEGTITLERYVPWIHTEPASTCGTYNIPAQNIQDWGGADICLTYQPAGSDPTGNAVHWLQVISTNSPTEYGGMWGHRSGGYLWYIDNGYNSQTNPPTNPFYDGSGNGYTANAGAFWDTPRRELYGDVDDWEAQVFIATWAPNNASNMTAGGTMTIYDGVWWGYTTAPEPATALLLTLAALLRRPRRNPRAP